ncbi:MAG: hypothetical protein ACX93T_01970 [Bacteroidota bacterium]
MNSTTLHVRVQDLEQKLAALLASYKEQQGIIQQLKKENAQLTQQAMNSLAINTIARNGTKHKNWEAMLDNYISDIDKSIAHLEKIQIQ